MHAPALSALEKLQPAHCLHVVDPAGEKRPAGHAEHPLGEVSPDSPLAVPAGQGGHVDTLPSE